MQLSWTKIPTMSMTMIEQFRLIAGSFDHAQEENLLLCTVEEGKFGENKVIIFIPKSLESIERRPAQIYYHWRGFIMGCPDNFLKECAKQAVIANAVIICPTIGTGPETKAKEFLKNGYAALKMGSFRSKSIED